ncbi:MAG TPA: hypothetical protein VG324_20985, partial [Blastocatellia bacterium]|nr:hypothetical protein [Blastocatellia bacterium]
MHPPFRLLSLVCLAAFAAITAQAQSRILLVKVLNFKDRPIRNVSVGLEGSGSPALTDDRGMAGIKLAPQIKPGTWVTLEASGGDFAFVSPWNRKVLIPPFGNESAPIVTVYLTTRGFRENLESGRFAVALAAKFNATLTTEEERKAALAEVARSYGVTPEDADRAIREWGKQAFDPYDRGVIALYQQNYSEATTRLSRSYEMR